MKRPVPGESMGLALSTLIKGNKAQSAGAPVSSTIGLPEESGGAARAVWFESDPREVGSVLLQAPPASAKVPAAR